MRTTQIIVAIFLAALIGVAQAQNPPLGYSTKSNQDTNQATTAHTCSTGGTSEIGCLGQVDDDVKASIPAGTNVIGYVTSDPCMQAAKSSTAISSTATETQIVNSVAGKRVYICAMNIMVATATSFNIVEGLGAACVSTPTAILGSTNATAGEQIATQGGFAYGGMGTILQSSVASNEVCILTSASTQYGGSIVYVQQ